MIIQISNDIRIRGTEYCWKLEQKRSRKGGTKYEPYKWFSSLRQALDAACERELREHPAETLQEAVSAISRIVRRYEKRFDQVA